MSTKIWVTKYALTRGVVVTDTDEDLEKTWFGVRWPEMFRGDLLVGHQEAFVSRTAALENVQKRIDSAIASAQKKLAKALKLDAEEIMQGAEEV